MGKKSCHLDYNCTAYSILDFLYAPALMLFVCRRLPANEKKFIAVLAVFLR